MRASNTRKRRKAGGKVNKDFPTRKGKWKVEMTFLENEDVEVTKVMCEGGNIILLQRAKRKRQRGTEWRYVVPDFHCSDAGRRKKKKKKKVINRIKYIRTIIQKGRRRTREAYRHQLILPLSKYRELSCRM